MKKIPLTQGKFSIVDDSDFEWLNQWKWHYLNIGYAARRDYSQKGKYVYMHRLIIGFPTNYQADHINRNKLDNRRSNLRMATKSQNMVNTDLRITNTSGYRGVYWDKNRNKWVAEIMIHYKKKHLGRFIHKEDAAKAYLYESKESFGEFAAT